MKRKQPRQDPHDIIRALDLPHTRDGRQWHVGQSYGMTLHYVSKLQEWGVPEIEIGPLIADLFWAAERELSLLYAEQNTKKKARKKKASAEPVKK